MRYLLDMLELIGDLSTYAIGLPIEVKFDKSAGSLRVIGDSAIFIVEIDSFGNRTGHTVPKELGMATLMPRDMQIELLLSSSIDYYETFDEVKHEY